MDHAQFWSTIDGVRGPNGKSSPRLLRALSRLSAPEIVGFDAWFWAYYLRTAREDLWAAVSVVRGGCGDDSFDYFRGWLISRGEAAVLAAIHDPECLPDLIGRARPFDEHMLGAALAAHRKVAGAPLPERGPDVAIPGVAAWPADRVARGLAWDAAFYAATFPRLHARFPKSVETARPKLAGSISHERFWAIIEAARVDTTDARAAANKVSSIKSGLTSEEQIGFYLWLSTYQSALGARRDLRTACRFLLGCEDGDVYYEFRDWLVLQGEAAVRRTVRELDTVMEHSSHPLPPNNRWLSHGVLLTIYLDVDWDPEEIPDREDWAPDLTTHDPTLAELRARFPRLTAELRDEQVVRAEDAWRVTEHGRQIAGQKLFERAKAMADGAGKLAVLEQALELYPSDDEVLAARGHQRALLGDLDAALLDLDAAIARRPDAWRTIWHRSQARLARGDRAGALADARQVAPYVAEARAWLTPQALGAKRVRHPQFGEGLVVSVEATGTEPKLVIDFASGRKTIASRFVEAIDGA